MKEQNNIENAVKRLKKVSKFNSVIWIMGLSAIPVGIIVWIITGDGMKITWVGLVIFLFALIIEGVLQSAQKEAAKQLKEKQEDKT